MCLLVEQWIAVEYTYTVDICWVSAAVVCRSLFQEDEKTVQEVWERIYGNAEEKAADYEIKIDSWSEKMRKRKREDTDE